MAVAGPSRPQKFRTPLDSPFSRALLLSMGVVGLLWASLLIREGSPFLILFAVVWLAGFACVVFIFLHGLRYERGVAIGGGLMWRRVSLDADEEVIFQAPALWGTYPFLNGGHLFVTGKRVILLPMGPFVLTRGPQMMSVLDLIEVSAKSSGIGWPVPKQSITLAGNDRRIILRPLAGWPYWRAVFQWMGLGDPELFLTQFMDALSRAGWRTP